MMHWRSPVTTEDGPVWYDGGEPSWSGHCEIINNNSKITFEQ